MRLLYFLFLLPAALLAQIPAGYYNSAQGLKGNNLKTALHNIIKNHTVISYSGLWSAFPSTDRKSNGKVWDIYSFKPTGAQPYEYTFFSDQCGSYSAEGDCYNREHSWPQSWFNATTGPDSDLFHIYPTDGKVNGQRSNYPYGKVGTANWTSQNGGKLGNSITAGYSGIVFEPINEFKGDLARTYFYMTTRYYTEDAAWGISDATNKSTILQWQLNLLLQWHQQDPVSAKEIARNDSVYKLQNNRNPFIDNPAYADSIWLSVAGLQERLHTADSYILYPNPAHESFSLRSLSGKNAQQISVTDLNGRIVFFSESAAELVDVSSFSPAVYFVTVTDDETVTRIKFVKY